MKLLHPALAVAFLLGSFVCTNAWADPRGRHHHRHHGKAQVGVFIGAPLFWHGHGHWRHDPFYDPFYHRYHYGPPVVLRPEPPPVYVERNPPAAPGSQFWYFCHSPQGYYPYVRECRSQWQAVAPDSVKPQEVR